MIVFFQLTFITLSYTTPPLFLPSAWPRYYREPPFPSGAAACLLRPNIAPESSPPESCGGREETGGGKSRLDPGGGNGSGVAVTPNGWGGWWTPRGGDKEIEGSTVWGTAEPVRKPRSPTNTSTSMPSGGLSRVCYLVGASVRALGGGSLARERAVGSVPSSVSGPTWGCVSGPNSGRVCPGDCLRGGVEKTDSPCLGAVKCGKVRKGLPPAEADGAATAALSQLRFPSVEGLPQPAAAVSLDPAGAFPTIGIKGGGTITAAEAATRRLGGGVLRLLVRHGRESGLKVVSGPVLTGVWVGAGQRCDSILLDTLLLLLLLPTRRGIRPTPSVVLAILPLPLHSAMEARPKHLSCCVFRNPTGPRICGNGKGLRGAVASSMISTEQSSDKASTVEGFGGLLLSELGSGRE
uniref:Uncharacterized protein n=1 Tax=Chromera velia CCMP2878 TaxID=1169474 RepID=A0A0G4FCS0_9ALVE|eukprot:Cvel_16212.t1-p1 / transcript=Cvel_16212.t1 / gene=Cvel_16212 / organism=Chromera_velia_CCMP2878 / gene_product=hypothetical protein / transcript_product=hypothetical protein / location=Cvel_scaffold1239:3081-8770(-) / protein_length=407 / sequence_SO=supercontig / SO=protein_coding / is_pseudo=false